MLHAHRGDDAFNLPTFGDRGESAKLGAKAIVPVPPPPPPLLFVPELGVANIIHQDEDQGQPASNEIKDVRPKQLSY